MNAVQPQLLEGKIVCNPSNYDPATDGNIVYQLVGDDDYEIEFRDLKGAKGIVIDSADSPHSYFTSRPNAVWIDHRGPGSLSAFVSGIELTTTAADAGSANARGFNLTLWSGADNDATTTDPTNGAEISLIRRDLVLTVEKSVFNTYARALTGVHLGTGDIQIDVTDTQITTTGPSGHGIVGWHETNGNVNVNAERVKIVSPQGYGVGGFVWSQLKFGRTEVPDSGDKTLSLSVRDSEIQAGTYGLYARHRGSGKIDILLSDSSITTAGLNGYGIFTRNDTRNATDNMEISVNVVNSKITTAAANTHGINDLPSGKSRQHGHQPHHGGFRFTNRDWRRWAWNLRPGRERHHGRRANRRRQRRAWNLCGQCWHENDPDRQRFTNRG